MSLGSLAKCIVVHLLAAMLYMASGDAIADQQLPEPTPVKGTLDISRWNSAANPVISLSGTWRFFPNTLLRPEQVIADRDALRQSSEAVAIPAPWNQWVGTDQWASRGHGTGTYWLEVNGAGPQVPLSLLVDRVCTSARIYFFDNATVSPSALATLGRVSATPAGGVPNAGSRMLSLPFSGATTHHLLIQVSNFDFFSGGLCGEVLLGTSNALRQQADQSIANHAILVTMVGMAALYLLAILTQPRNRNKRAIWVTSFCLCCWLFFISTSGLLEILIANHPQWLYPLRVKLAFFGLTWGSTSLVMFYTSYYPLYRKRRLLSASLALSSAFTAFVLFSSPAAVTSLHTLWVLFWAAQALYCAWILGRACINKQRYSLHNLIAIAPLMLAIPYDAWTRVALNEMPLFSLYALVFFIFGQGMLMGRRISEAVALAGKLSLYLKEEVTIRTAELNDRNERLKQTQRELEDLNNALKKLSITDGLTGIYNRLHFDQEYRKEWRRSSRLRKPISILMIDVDHFKQLNDSAGHMAGDMALRAIANTLHQHFKRAGDIVARYGGEEFVVMLPNTNQRTAVAIAEGVRGRIERLDFRHEGTAHKITISIGISTSTPTAKTSPDTLLATADSALYQAKNAGRNRVEAIPLLPSLFHGSKRRQRQ